MDAELEKQIKDSGKQLSHPPDSVDQLLPVLDNLENLLSKVDQSPKRSMLDALKPSMKALIQDSLSKHSDIDVKVAVACCISEITRITAPDAPYDDDQMKDVFQLIVSSFEGLADQYSRSYIKRVSILETVSKVRSSVIMLDLECDALIVEMFEHFLKSVRDYHLDAIFSSMENIMVLVLEESEDIPVGMLKPLLASVKKDNAGILPIARKLGEGVFLRSAEKLKPYIMPALKSLGESLDMYTKVVTDVCEGTIATFENNDENTSALQLDNESKLEKGSVDETQQIDESKLTTSSDHTDQVVKEEACPEDKVDPTVDRSPKSVTSNGVDEVGNEEASVDQESIKPEEDISQRLLNKEDTDDSDTDKSAKVKSQTEQTSIINSAEPSDSSHVEGEKENDKEKDNDVKESENEKDNDVKELENEKGNDVNESENEKENDVNESENEKENDVNELENEKENDVKESENKAVIPSETEKDSDGQVCSPKAIENKPTATANVSSPSQSNSLPDERSVRSKKKQVPQEDETASPSNGGLPSGETIVKNVGRAKNKGLTREDTLEEQKGTGKKKVIAKEIKLPDDTVNGSEDGEATSDSDAKPAKKPESKSKSKPKSTKQSGKKPKPSGKKVDVGESDAKKPKQTGKKVDVKGEDSDSDAKQQKTSVKKGEKSKVAIEKEEESDSESKPLKEPAKKSGAKKKDTGKKRGNSKNVTEKDLATSLSEDDEMDCSPKSTTKSAKGEGTSKETPVTSAKRKRTTVKDNTSDTIKYDESLVGTKVKVWWPEDKMYYEGVVEKFYPAKKKHKVSYLDGDEETLNLRTQRWEILQEFSRDNKEQTAEDQSEEASPVTNKKKKSKIDPAPSTSQEKVKDSAKRAGGASSSGKSKKENSSAKSSQKTSGKSSDAAASKEAGKSKEDEETPKAGTRTKTTNKSKGKTPPSSSKSNTNGPSKAKSGSSNVKESDDVKTPDSGKGKSTETAKGGSKSGKKRKKRN
ncbi:hypothetical protein QVD17_28403 [Tagetes erecta]|uniref:Tudor domain-containing protein n=1 Tax=Tagetes erecta TaxID=13708 RepID=A0AAD8KAB0_TARER|nr:hypothetical protein QVD17_28403 [Tagetes erecta]